MKKINFLLLIFIILLSAQNIFAYDFYTKEIHKGFLYKENMQLNIQNRYGNISVIPTQQDSITIDVTVSVEHYEEEKANKLLDEINIQFHKYNNIAKAETTISRLFKTGLKFSINYIVRMPSDVKLNINNKFGNVNFEGDIESVATLDIEYGKLFANRIKCQDTLSKHIIKLNYSEADIKESDNIKLMANYSKVKIGLSKQLIVASKYTKLSLDSNTYLIASCHYDSYFINKTKSANILKGTKSNISIKNLNERAEIKLNEGEINITPEGIFKYINITTKDVNTTINIAQNIQYLFDLNYIDSKITYPLDAEIISLEKDEFSGSNILKGIFGNRSNINSSLKIESTGGKIDLK